VLAKRLDRGTFAWPPVEASRMAVQYREEQLALLLSGFDTDVLRPRRRRRRAAG